MPPGAPASPQRREANTESAEAAPRLEAAAELQREHSLLAPTAGRGVEPVLPDPVPMLHTNSGGGRRSCEPDAGAGQQIGSAAASILARRSERARAKLLDKVRDAGRANGDPAASEERMASTTLRSSFLPDSDEEIRGESARKKEMRAKILSGSGSAGRS